MEIRSATFVDVPALIALANASAEAAHWTAAQHLKAVIGENSIYLIAMEDGAPAGFIVGSTVAGDCELENIVVTAAQQRQGIASGLLREFLAQTKSKGVSRVMLEVRQSNQAARAFYSSRGFVETGRRKNYYAGPEEDAILYELVVAP